MAYCKNVGGAPAGASRGDGGDERPCCLTVAKKGKKVVIKKRKITDRDTKTARAVAVVDDSVEASSRRCSLRIASELSST